MAKKAAKRKPQSDVSEPSVLEAAYNDAIRRVASARRDSATWHEHRIEDLLAELIFQVKVCQDLYFGSELRLESEARLRSQTEACSLSSGSESDSSQQPSFPTVPSGSSEGR
jgi:hypothetical protein